LTFFLVFTSQLMGIPFAFETMLRSGVPPHIGQSPVPGSEAETEEAEGRRQKAVKSTAANRRTTFFPPL
jgi:hypothetical protein